MKLFSTFLTMLFCAFNVLGATYTPSIKGSKNFETLNDWQTASNWNCTNDCASSSFPQNGDVVLFGNTSVGSGGASVQISFDLSSTYNDISFQSSANNSVLIFSGDVIASNIIDNNKATITIDNGATVLVNNTLTLNKNGSILNNNGDLTIYGSLNFATGTAQTLNNSGKLTIEEDLSIEGGTLNITGGEVIVKEDWIIPSNNANWSNSLNISDGASMEVLGYVEFNSEQALPNPGGQINVDGSFTGTCEVEGAEGSLCDIIQQLNDASLPVTLISFYGEKVDNGFILKWETASEQNSERFDIEASNNRKSWDVIGSVQAQGNTQTNFSYSFLNTDQQFSYYRLVQYDIDGAKEYYGVIFSNHDQKNVTIYPTFLTEERNCKLFFDNVNEGERVKILLLNLKGDEILNKTISTISEANNYTIIELPPSINNGVYIIYITIGYDVYQKKILIN